MTRRFVHETDRLKAMLLEMSAEVEESVREALAAVANNDAGLARRVMAGERQVNREEIDIEEECLKLLALHQPVAFDLRFVVAILKMNADLERINDLAAHIAEQSLLPATPAATPLPDTLQQMGRDAGTLVHQALDSFIAMDVDQARLILVADKNIDRLHRETFELAVRALQDDPLHPDAALHTIAIARHIERIADHATNIAEDVIYLATGDIIRHGEKRAR